MPPGSSQDRQTWNPPAAWAAACSVTFWPLLLRFSVTLTPAAATFARSLSVRTASARTPDAVCRTPASSTPPTASAMLPALPSTVYISSFSRLGAAGGWGTQCRQRRQQHDRQGRAEQSVPHAAVGRGVVSGRRCHGPLLTGGRLRSAGLYPAKKD